MNEFVFYHFYIILWWKVIRIQTLVVLSKVVIIEWFINQSQMFTYKCFFMQLEDDQTITLP